jgi:hypothetical protein
MAFSLPGEADPDPDRQQKFEALARAMVGFGGRSVEIRFGVGTWTYPGGHIGSNITTVSHGLGRVPVVATAFALSDQGPDEMITGMAFTYTATTFGTRGIFKTSVLGAGATASFGWIAIG